MVEDRHAVGLSGTLDLKLSEANVAGSRAQLSRAVRGRDVIARQIEVLLGRFPAAELEASGAFEGLPPAVPAGIPAEVLARRPDMVALERRMTAAERAGLVDTHKTHLLCLIARAAAYDRAASSPLARAMAASVVPTW